MQRTQIYFPKDMLDQLRREAYKQKKTLAAVIRDKVEKANKTKPTEINKKELKKNLKLLDEITKLNLPTTTPKKMKKMFADAHSPHL
jgi:cytochrome b involved in lipid metabolism